MKKYLILVVTILLLAFGVDYGINHLGWFVDFKPGDPVTCFTKTEERKILLDDGNGYREFEIRGVDMGSGIPGKWSTDFAGDKETYLRWFKEIREMGANTIRVYTINSEDFYEAFYEFNQNNDRPLYLLQGVWVDEYAQFSHEDGYSDGFVKTFRNDCIRMVDVIHGHRRISKNESANAAGGNFKRDISPWVLGYILGVEWEGDVTALTNDKYREDPKRNSFSGEYLYTSEEASPFEALLAYVGDSVIRYESQKYKEQRLLAFSNWPATDPFDYPEPIQEELHKDTKIDVEHILSTDRFVSGQFASYHIYPYYPCYINYLDDWGIYGIDDRLSYITGDGIESYRAYLTGIVNHHKMPVVISEFGVPSSRGMASMDVRTGRNQGRMTEKEQGKALTDCYRDIMEAGCAGSCVFAWQDEWFKRTWNTLHAVDLRRNPYWSDYQTNEQFFGLLTFEPGKKETVCTLDGKDTEWENTDVASENGNFSIKTMYDEKFLYLLVKGKELDFQNDTIFIPIDTTQKTGSSYCSNYKLKFDRAADFLLVINGEGNSRLLVQERYDAARSTYSKNMLGFDTYLAGNIPDTDSPRFSKIMFPLQEPTALVYGDQPALQNQYETGKLLYGTADSQSPAFNSIADFCASGDVIEIRLPWQLLNFSDPSKMEIHDDYYLHYGVAYQNIDGIYLGIGGGSVSDNARIPMSYVPMAGWGEKVHAHERLKESYYAMQQVWTGTESFESDKQKHAEKTVRISMEQEVPSLMYHDFVSADVLAEDPHYELGYYAIWAEDFEKDLMYLRDNGFTTITCQDLIGFANGEKELPERPVLLTIDDGRFGVYACAYPLLKKYGMTATLSVIGEKIDTETNEDAFHNREYLFCTWDEILEMEESGAVEIVSHTYGLHDDENDETKVGASMVGGFDESFLDTAVTDYIKISDTLRKRTGSFHPVMSYPYSAHSARADEIWTEIGYRLFLCGDPYTIQDSVDNSFVSNRVMAENIRIVPRIARLSTQDVEYYLNICRDSVRKVMEIWNTALKN